MNFIPGKELFLSGIVGNGVRGHARECPLGLMIIPFRWKGNGCSEVLTPCRISRGDGTWIQPIRQGQARLYHVKGSFFLFIIPCGVGQSCSPELI